jgi:hypothetical protein
MDDAVGCDASRLFTVPPSDRGLGRVDWLMVMAVAMVVVVMAVAMVVVWLFQALGPIHVTPYRHASNPIRIIP